MSRYSGAVLKQLDRIFNHGTVAGLTEGKLLERYVEGRDEAAFAALVSLHGPMVLGVCRRILRDENDVEDAFQATFLVLVRRAGAIRRGELVSHWLHGVAHRVAVRARAQAARRHVHEPAGLEIDEISTCRSPGEESRHDLRMILDEELSRLPASLRAPVVLCYLEGLTHDEAAARLRWPVGTIRSRLARARERLRRRLARQGIMTDAAALTAVVIREPVSPGLIDSTVQASLGFATKQATAASAASSAAAALARGVLHAMMISKIKILGAAAVAGILALGGARTLARQYGGTGATGQPATVSPAPGDRRSALLRSVDRIDQVLADIDRRNLDLQTELRALRKEIAALRTGEPERLKNAALDASTPQERVARNAPMPRQETDSPSVDRLKNPPVSKGQLPNARIAGRAVPDEGVASGAATSDSGPTHFDNGQYIGVMSSRGDRVAIHNRQTGETQTVRFPVPEGSRHTVTPICGQGIIALHIKGPNVSRIAVYTSDGQPDEGWYSQDLREPVDEASVLVSTGGTAAYALGRYVYGFSSAAKRWDVLELPPGSQPVLRQDASAFTVRNGSHLYEFMQPGGRWHDLDFNAILDLPPVQKSKYVRKLGPIEMRQKP